MASVAPNGYAYLPNRRTFGSYQVILLSCRGTRVSGIRTAILNSATQPLDHISVAVTTTLLSHMPVDYIATVSSRVTNL